MSSHGDSAEPTTPIGKFLKTWVTWESWMAMPPDWGVSRALVLGAIFFGCISVLASQIPNFALFYTGWLIGLAPIWLPIALGTSAWFNWIHYAKHLYIFKRESVLLEVKIPRDIMKSPRAMELVFNNFYLTAGETTVIDRAWKGGTRPWWSFEIASFGGDIHFYVWTWKNTRRFAEANIYAQYPEVEIFEVDDYASKFVYDPKIHMCWGSEYQYDPKGDEYPIRSYIDFELDKDPKEEFKIDPLATVLEMLAALKPHEQAWIQMVFRGDGKQHGVIWPSKSGWKDRVQKEIGLIRKAASLQPGKEDAPESDEKKYGFPRPTWRETEQIRSMERHMSKIPYEVGMRGIFIATNGEFHGPTYTSIRWIWKPYNSPMFSNGLRPRGWHNPIDYPWQDIFGWNWIFVTRRFLDAYRRRSYFSPPWEMKTMIMSPETMASLYHYPSRTIVTPGIQRIPAKKAEPPPNLPR